jgi:glycosyltransferase involved in cell wall biosynthesis
MRVLFVAGEFPPDVGGLGDYTALLAQHLAAAGIEVGVLTRAGAAAKVAGVGVFPLVQGWGSAAWWPVLGAVRQFRPDLVHIQYQAAAFGLAPAAMLLPVVLRRLGPFPAAVTFHDLRPPYLFPKAGPLRRLAVELVYRTSAGAVVTNGVDLTCLQGLRFPSGAARPPLAFIPIGSNIPVVPVSPDDLGRLRRDHGVGPDERLVGYFGLLNWSKGVELALGACRQLIDSGLRVRLVLIGGSAGRTDPTNLAYAGFIKRRIEELGLGREVLWTGPLPAGEVSRWLQAADVMLLPYLDGASLRRGSLVAALVHGRPVVTTRPPDPRAIQPLSGGEHLLLTGPRPEALAGAVREVLSDPVLAGWLAEKARQAAGLFDWDGIARRHLDFYRVIGAGVAC